jgi:hypothetical protein
MDSCAASAAHMASRSVDTDIDTVILQGVYIMKLGKRVTIPTVILFLMAFLSFLAPEANGAVPVSYQPENDPRPAQGVVANPSHAVVPNLPIKNGKRVLPGETPGTGDYGIRIDDDTGITGIRGYFSVQLSIVINQGSPARDVIHYAPTTLAPKSCLEMVIANYRIPSSPTTGHFVGFWDQCGNGVGGDGADGWQFTYDTGLTSFRTNYVLQTTFAGVINSTNITDKVVYMRTYQETWGTGANNCWVSDIWNWVLNQYDRAARACGTPDTITHGWTMFETYGYDTPTAPSCTTLGFYNLAETRAVDVQRNHSTGLWDFLAATDTDKYPEIATPTMPCFASGAYKFRHNASTRDWIVCGLGNTANC